MASKNKFCLEIGSKLWRRTSVGGQEHFEQVAIVDQNRVSWILADGKKLPKNQEASEFFPSVNDLRVVYYMTEEAALNGKAQAMRWELSDILRNSATVSAERVREIATLMHVEIKLP